MAAPTFGRLPLLMLCLAVASARGAESVPNGDFEKQENGSLAGWEPDRAIHRLVPNTDAGTETLMLRFVWDTDSHGGGKGSLRVDGKGIQQGGKWDTASGIIVVPVNRMIVQPETEYKLAWFFKARGLSAQTKMVTTVFVQSPGPTAPPPGASRFLTSKNNEQTKDANAWQPGSLTFKTPKGTGWAQVRLEVFSAEPQKKFSVWWDDFVLTRTDGKPVEYDPPAAWTAPRTIVPGGRTRPGWLQAG